MAATESSSVMTQKLNPQTGEVGWQVQDEGYDYHQEIARSAFADMLHDSERNEKYFEGIKAAVEQVHLEGRQAHVLDIGTGTGLLAMMAAQCGADTIHACEAFSPISKCAEKVIEENGLSNRITVIHKRSTSLTVTDGETTGDLPWRCNILVTEVFDTELIGEGAIETFNHAHIHLLEKGAVVVPSWGTVYAQVVECDWMQRWNQLAPWGEVAPSQAIQQCPGAAAVHDLQLSQLCTDDFRPITEPEPVFRFNWTDITPEEDQSTVVTKAINSGTAQMVFMWWTLNMDPQGKIVLSCAPWWAHHSRPRGPDDIPWRDHWMQAVYYLASPVPVTEGQTLRLLSNHDEFSLWFGLDKGNNFSSILKEQLAKYFPRLCNSNPEVNPSQRPICSCMLHVACSRTRIGMLNDPVRREKYFKVLQQKVTPTSVVLSYGDTSLLGLVAATLGAEKVYHIEENYHSRQVMEELVDDNDLSSKVSIVNRVTVATSSQIKSTVNLVVGEPYLTTALSPWHISRWWQLRDEFPNAEGMPLSASLYAMPMQFDHLHKIRAPLGTISGFKMTPFDQLIQSSSSISDSNVEVHPLWEYPGICLGQPMEISTFQTINNFVSMGNASFKASGRWNGVALWVDIRLDADTFVSTGPVEPPTPGHPVRWDPYTRQAVYFILPETPVTDADLLQYSAIFNSRKGDNDIQFKFNLQNNELVMPTKEKLSFPPVPPKSREVVEMKTETKNVKKKSKKARRKELKNIKYY